MKIIFQPIFIIFFTLLVLSFSFSMRSSDWQIESTRENLDIVEAENRRLLLQEQELEYQEMLSALPFNQEKNIRNQRWLQDPKETVLEIKDFTYVEQTLPADLGQEVELEPAQEWQELIFENGW